MVLMEVAILQIFTHSNEHSRFIASNAVTYESITHFREKDKFVSLQPLQTTSSPLSFNHKKATKALCVERIQTSLRDAFVFEFSTDHTE